MAAAAAPAAAIDPSGGTAGQAAQKEGEADRRKAAFLLEAQRVTAAPVRVHAARIEQAGLQPATS